MEELRKVFLDKEQYLIEFKCSDRKSVYFSSPELYAISVSYREHVEDTGSMNPCLGVNFDSISLASLFTLIVIPDIVKCFSDLCKLFSSFSTYIQMIDFFGLEENYYSLLSKYIPYSIMKQAYHKAPKGNTYQNKEFLLELVRIAEELRAEGFDDTMIEVDDLDPQLGLLFRVIKQMYDRGAEIPPVIDTLVKERLDKLGQKRVNSPLLLTVLKEHREECMKAFLDHESKIQL